MVQLTLQKRLAADILKCGKRRVVFTPDHEKYIQQATSRAAIRNLISSKIVSKRAVNAVSHGRFRMHLEAKRLGRHSGHGRRKGSRNARMPTKTLWTQRQRVLRRMARRYRDTSKIDKHLYQQLYSAIKGNQFKNKRVLLEHIISMKDEQKRQDESAKEASARRARASVVREKRLQRIKDNRVNFALGKK